MYRINACDINWKTWIIMLKSTLPVFVVYIVGPPEKEQKCSPCSGHDAFLPSCEN